MINTDDFINTKYYDTRKQTRFVRHSLYNCQVDQGTYETTLIVRVITIHNMYKSDCKNNLYSNDSRICEHD